MGLFDRLLNNDFEVAGKKLFEHVTDRRTRAEDERLAKKLGVALDALVDERCCMRKHGADLAFSLLGENPARKGILQMAYAHCQRLMLRYFEADQGGKDDGMRALVEMDHRYSTIEPIELAEKLVRHIDTYEVWEGLDDAFQKEIGEWARLVVKESLMFTRETTKGLST